MVAGLSLFKPLIILPLTNGIQLKERPLKLPLQGSF